MSGSDEKSWPAADRRATAKRRGTERRSGGERRTGAVAKVKVDRRTHAERRVAERRSGRDRRSDAGWEPVALDLGSDERRENEAALLVAAVDARTHARSRYSGFAVGAALETADGRVITGCNIENATYGLTLCAERVALVKALSEGEGVFTRIAVVADTEAPTPPCGPCRQLLWEYCGDIDIILGNLNGPTGRYRLSTLLPLPFDARLLG
ncbi:MAG TPA: cytidine deaminase [Vicinamibacterales bacterium]